MIPTPLSVGNQDSVAEIVLTLLEDLRMLAFFTNRLSYSVDGFCFVINADLLMA